VEYLDKQLRVLYQERSSHQDTLGILLIQKKEMLSPITDGFDDMVVVVTENTTDFWDIHHYHYEDKKVQVITVNKDDLNEWLSVGRDKRILEWIVYGKIIFDRNDYILTIRKQLLDFPFELRSKKLCIEFSRLIRCYIEGKELLRSGDYLDSFNQILQALHHWARLSIIASGFRPEIMLWKQVKKIDPEIHKLYEELLKGSEPLEKRLELLLLASEFSLTSKTELGAGHLIDIMKSKKDPWSVKELSEEPEVKEYTLDLGILLEHLVKKNIVQEAIASEGSKAMKNRYYVIK
jgi:hypothetical protein